MLDSKDMLLKLIDASNNFSEEDKKLLSKENLTDKEIIKIIERNNLKKIFIE